MCLGGNSDPCEITRQTDHTAPCSERSKCDTAGLNFRQADRRQVDIIVEVRYVPVIVWRISNNTERSLKKRQLTVNILDHNPATETVGHQHVKWKWKA